MHHHVRATLVALAAALAIAACGDDSANGRSDAAEANDATDIIADDGADAEPDGLEASGEDGEADAEDEADAEPPCMVPGVTCLGDACHAAPYSVSCVGGTVVDETGAPLSDQPVVVCAGLRCVAGRSDSDGWFAVSVGLSGLYSIGLYFPPSTPRLTPFCSFPDLCDDAVHLCNEFVLYPAPTAGVTVPTGTLVADLRIEASDGGALVIPAGAEVVLPIEAEGWLALTRFPLEEHVPCFVDPANLPLALYAVTPSDDLVIEGGSSFDPVLAPAGIDVPNETGLAAGAEVDIYVVGGVHAIEAGMTEGEWRSWAVATVTPDGTRIRTAPGVGIAYLTWFAIYAR